MTPDSGKVTIERGTRVSYLPQSGVEVMRATRYDEAESTYDEAKVLIAEMRGLVETLRSHKEQSAETEELLARYHYLQETHAGLDYYSQEREIQKTLS